MKIIAVICARSKSTRLPNKMMAELGGYPLLYHVVFHTRESKLIDDVVVATVEGDGVISEFCDDYGIKCYCGEEDDIIDRIYQASGGADVIVRVWGDSPLVDPEIIDKTICEHLKWGYDYTYSRNHPLGQNVAVISMSALKRAWYEIKDPEDRLWFHRFMTEKTLGEILYRIGKYHSDIGHSDWNYSVDTKEDLEKIEEWYERGQTPDGRKISPLG